MPMHNMNKRLIAVLCTTLLSFGCTSTSPGLNYYVFNAPSSVLPAHRDINQTVVLEAIVLADYLRQSSLVMQVAEHKLYFSSQDLWAEGLQGSIQKALLSDLNASGNTLYVASSRENNKANQASVNLQIDHLLVTNKGTVMISGQYSISDLQAKPLLNTPYIIELPLQEDGFAHAVVQQRILVSQLANKIQADLSALVIQ
jgi:uncharacterized protein